MLHQTLPTFPSMQSFCFSSSSLPAFSPPSLVKREMEGVETNALKASVLADMNARSSQEEVWLENIVPESDFFVDDLLDFSKDEVFDEEENGFVSVEEKQSENVERGDSVTDVFTELSVPADDLELEQLEWLSQFVEDSEQSHQYPEQKQQNQNPLVKFQNPKESGEETEEKVQKPEILRIPFPGKPRSKRSRKGVQVWSLGSSSSITEVSVSSCSSSSSSGSGSTISNPSCIMFPNFNFLRRFAAPPAKRRKKTDDAGQAVQRRCSHCGVQKTPQWRQGPEGAKTLCNACGVRYKSGRLLPEYRPACSPTFSSKVHSNNHRKVLEMRMKKKEPAAASARPGSGLGRPVQSF